MGENSKNNKPSSQKLKVALRGLKYEQSMLECTAKVLNSGRYKSNDVVHNALAESFIAHARLLIEFLYKDTPYKDNIMARDFFSPQQKWEDEIRLPKGDLLDETEQDAHKYLAHFTYARLLEKKEWPYNEILAELKARLDVFWGNLSEGF